MATVVTTKFEMSIEGDNYPKKSWGGTVTERTQTNSGGGNPGIINLTTSEEDCAFGEMTSPREVLIRNLSSTETVILGPKSSGAMVAFLQIPPLGCLPLELYQTALPTLRWKATGACRVEIAAADN